MSFGDKSKKVEPNAVTVMIVIPIVQSLGCATRQRNSVAEQWCTTQQCHLAALLGSVTRQHHSAAPLGSATWQCHSAAPIGYNTPSCSTTPIKPPFVCICSWAHLPGLDVSDCIYVCTCFLCKRRIYFSWKRVESSTESGETFLSEPELDSGCHNLY